MKNYANYKISRMDCVYGTVVGGDKNKGVYIRLENDEIAFANFGYLPNGTVVLCTYLNTPKSYNPNARVEIDSVISDCEYVA